MLYLNDSHVEALGTDWEQLVSLIEDVVRADDRGECVHPLKPYLRFGGAAANRIIAMPAYVGGAVETAGLKWIASFPGNRRLGLPRAHNAIVLNRPDTGEPIAFLHSGRLNGLRTAAVSGAMLRAFMASRRAGEGEPPLRLGIIGWGPIGRLHLDMCAALLGDRLGQVMLHDLQGVDPATVPPGLRDRTVIVDDWRPLYRASNVTATCTVSAARYIDEPPPAGALLLNVSLRDYEPTSIAHAKPAAVVVVDDWREVCRENTDIEQLQLRHGLGESDVRTLADVVCRQALAGGGSEGETVFFSPMGLGIFDIAVAETYRRKALERGVGVLLD
ncbi:2,3-diaminopropionate biosynthesis protein SbnB [Paenibacillus koleovorans]|uniref:2,3-diaminopropionate biosynthesis protein SbnB n=1 Tax=Paenibacillus koleovorans TaxID=121608 RepID=UPI000FDB7935|nr:2,3-diaminopropionate biosynthesis protein SbnB [Paenibacillus koleovorans]